MSVHIAKELKIPVYGFDLIPEFVKYANQKATEWKVGSLCHFDSSDVNELVNTEKNFDCVIFGAAGNILGSPEKMLKELMKPITSNGSLSV